MDYSNTQTDDIDARIAEIDAQLAQLDGAGGANAEVSHTPPNTERRALGFAERHGAEYAAQTGIDLDSVYGRDSFLGDQAKVLTAVAPFAGKAGRAASAAMQKVYSDRLKGDYYAGDFDLMKPLEEWEASEGKKIDLVNAIENGTLGKEYEVSEWKPKGGERRGLMFKNTKTGEVTYAEDELAGTNKEEARANFVKELTAGTIGMNAQTKRDAQTELQNNDAGFLMDLAHGATSSLGFVGEFVLGGALAKGVLGTGALATTKLGKAAEIAAKGGKLSAKASAALTSAEIALPTLTSAVERYENLTADDYRMDDEGNVYLAEKGDGVIRGAGKAMAGAAFENATEVALGKVVNKVFGATMKGIYHRVPGVKKMFDGTLAKIGDKNVDMARRAWTRATQTYAKVQKAAHFELMPVGEYAEEYAQGLGDDVWGMNVRDSADNTKFADFNKDFFSWDGQGKDLFFGIMGQSIALGLGGYAGQRGKRFRNSLDSKVIGTLKLQGYENADLAKMSAATRIALAAQSGDRAAEAVRGMGYDIIELARLGGVKEREIDAFKDNWEKKFGKNKANTYDALDADGKKKIDKQLVDFAAPIYSAAYAFREGMDGATELMSHLNKQMNKAIGLMEERQGLGNYRQNKTNKPSDFMSRLNWDNTVDAQGNINWQSDEKGEYIESAPVDGEGGARIYRSGDKFVAMHPQTQTRHISDTIAEAHDWCTAMDKFAQKKNADRDAMAEYIKFNANRLVPVQTDKKTGTKYGAPVVIANDALDAVEKFDWLDERDVAALEAAAIDGTEGGGFTTSNGVVIMLLDNLNDANDALFTLAHELGGHMAIREGTKAKNLSLDDTIAEVYSGSKTKDDKAYENERSVRLEEGEGEQRAMQAAKEEAMVTGNEYRMPTASPLQKAKTAVKVWMKQHGFNAKLTDEDYEAIAAAGLNRIRQTQTGETGTRDVSGYDVDADYTEEGDAIQHQYEKGKWVSNYYEQREKLEAARAAMDAADAAKRRTEEAAKEQAKIDKVVVEEDERKAREAEAEQMRKDAEHATLHGREMVMDLLDGWYHNDTPNAAVRNKRIVENATDEEIREILDYMELEWSGKASDGTVLEIAKRINRDIIHRTVSEKQKAQREAFAKRTREEKMAREEQEKKLVGKFTEFVQENPRSMLAFWMANGRRLLNQPITKQTTRSNRGKIVGTDIKFSSDNGLDAEALQHFFDGLQSDERDKWMRIIFGEDYAKANRLGTSGKSNTAPDGMNQRWISFKRGIEINDNAGITEDEDFNDFGAMLRRLKEEYEAYEQWKSGDQLTAEEKRAADELEAYNAAMDEESAALTAAQEAWSDAIATSKNGEPISDPAKIAEGDTVTLPDETVGNYNLEVVGRNGDLIYLEDKDNPLMEGEVLAYRWNKEKGEWDYAENQTADEGGQNSDKGTGAGVTEPQTADGDTGAVERQDGADRAAAEASRADTVKAELENLLGDEYRRIEDEAGEWRAGGLLVLAQTMARVADLQDAKVSAKSLAAAIADAWKRHTYESVRATQDILNDALKRDGLPHGEIDADFYEENPRTTEERLDRVYGRHLTEEEKRKNREADEAHRKEREEQRRRIEKTPSADTEGEDLTKLTDDELNRRIEEYRKVAELGMGGDNFAEDVAPLVTEYNRRNPHQTPKYADDLNLDEKAIQNANSVSWHEAGDVLVKDAHITYANGLKQLADREDWTEEERAQARAERAKWKKLVEDAYNDRLRRRGNWVSPIVAGPSKYNQRKWEKRHDAMMKASSEWAEKLNSFVGNARKRIADAAPQEVQIQRIRDYGTNEAIKSDDENAVAKIQAKIDNLRAEQEQMKAMNAWFRKHKTMVGFEGLSESAAKAMDVKIADQYNFQHVPSPSWMLSNNNANIRRLEQRLEEMKRNAKKASAAQEAGPQKHSWGEVIENADANRLQIDFGGEKPSAEVRELLKHNGFKWSPKNEVWQRQLTDNARYAMERIAPELDRMMGDAEDALTLESATADELAAEQKRIAQKAEIQRRLDAPLKTGKGEMGQTLMDLGGAEGEDLFNRTVAKTSDEKAKGVWRRGFDKNIKSAGRYTGELRNIAHGMKVGAMKDLVAGAELMKDLVPQNAVIVPMPNHEGSPIRTMLLGYCISGLRDDIDVVPALLCEPHEGSYHDKKIKKRPNIKMMRDESVSIPEGRPVVVIDNVIASGATWEAAKDVLNNAQLVTLADATRGKVGGSGKWRRNSAVTPEMDAAYADAVKRGDKETASNLEHNAEIANGYTVRAWHGSGKLGFTNFDPSLSDDGISLFFSTSSKLVDSYIPGLTYRDSYRSVNDAVTGSRMMYDKNKQYTEADIEKAINLTEKFNGHFYGGYKIDTVKKRVYWKALRQYESFKSIINGANTTATSGRYKVAINPNGMLQVDGKRNNWNEIPFKIGENTVSKTRDIAKWAKENGYSGVIINNIKDNGGRNSYAEFNNDANDVADVIIAFSPSQVKSADTAIYDDAGNLIPLSQRFNEESNDIRWRRTTAKPFSRAEMLALEKHFGTTDDLNAAGWLLPDGKMLDFNRDFHREDMEEWVEHFEIEQGFVGERKEKMGDETERAHRGWGVWRSPIDEAASAGGIRFACAPAGLYMDIHVEPTAKQYEMLERIANHNWFQDRAAMADGDGDGHFIDFGDGTTITYPDNGELSRRLVADIKRHFSGAEETDDSRAVRMFHGDGNWRRNSSVTPEMDAAYADAVKRGDKETALRMIREAAANAGYTYAVFHGTNAEFTKFQMHRPGTLKGIRSAFFSDDSSTAGSYGKNKMRVILKMNNPFVVDANGSAAMSISGIGVLSQDDVDEINKLWGSHKKITDDFSTDQIGYATQKRGYYDGVIFNGVKDSYHSNNETTVYEIFNSRRVKSADITYDDADNLIPLSERFNAESNDIRWRRNYTPNPDAQRLADIRVKSTTDILRNSKFGTDNAALFAAEKLARELAQQGSISPELRDLIERTQTGAVADRAKGNAAAIFSPQNLSMWREKMQDSLISVREMEDKLGIKKDASVYHQFDRNYGIVDMEVRNMHRDIIEPLTKELRDNGIGLADFQMLLQSLHGGERNKMIAERSPYVLKALNDKRTSAMVQGILNGTNGKVELNDADIKNIATLLGWVDNNDNLTKEAREFADDLRGSGATTAYWNGKIAEFKASGMFAKAQKAVSLVRELMKRNRDLLVKTGRLSAAQRDLWEKLSPNYVPLRSDMEMDTNMWSRWLLGAGKDKGDVGGKRYAENEYNHAYGRGTLADNPLEFAIQQYEESLQRAYDNVARQRLADMVRHNPNLGKVFRYEPRMTPTKRAHYAKAIAIIKNMVNAGTATADDVAKMRWYQEAFNADAAIPTVRVLGANGIVHEMPNIAGLEGTKDNPTGIIAFKEDGDLKFIKLGGFEQSDISTDPDKLDDVSARRIATAIKKQNMSQLNGFGRAMRKATGLFSALRTAYSPTFMLSNLGADNTQAARNIYATFGIGAVGKFEHYAYHSFRAALAVLNGQFDSTKIQQYAKEWLENGGKIGGMATSNIADLTDDLKRTMRKLNSQGKQLADINSVKDFITWMGDRKSDFEDFAEKWNNVVEMSTRIATYATARDLGYSVEDAVSYSRDVTVNFNRKGTLTPWLNAMYAFSNATMQDLHRSLVAFGEGRTAKGFGILAGRGAKMGFGLMMMGFIASMLGFWQDDPDDEKEGKAQWKYAKEWQKQNVLGVRIGERTFGVPIRGISRIPFYLGHQVYEAMTGRKSVAKLAADTVALAASNVTDFMGQASSPLMTAVPSIARDPIDIFISNKTFTGQQRYREPLPGTEETAVRSEMGRRGTSEVAKWLARAINKATGGDEGKRGLVDMQPEKIQGVWDWVFGSAGKDVSNAIGTAKDAVTLNLGNRELRNIPYLSRFARNLDENSATYYEARNKYEQVKKHYNTMSELGNADKMREDVAEHPWLSSRGTGKRWGTELKDLDGAVKKLMKIEKAASPDDYEAIHQLRLKTQYQFMRRLEQAPMDDAEGVQAEREHKRAMAPLLRSSKRDTKREQREKKKLKRLF